MATLPGRSIMKRILKTDQFEVIRENKAGCSQCGIWCINADGRDVYLKASADEEEKS